MEQNLKVTVRYDGSEFAGWQIQPGLRTVQGVIEGALSQIAGRLVRIEGAGRTDAGVHALGQVFSCRWMVSDAGSAAVCDRLARSLSKMLGPEIRIEGVESVSDDFHARKSAVSKVYAYALNLTPMPDPFSARYAWCVPWPIAPSRLSELAAPLVGMHDFAGFQCSGASVQTTVRTIHSIAVMQGGVVEPCDSRDLWRVEFHGNGFLYKMVRNIMGVLVDIARGHLPESRLDELIGAPGPFRGHSAPAHGLALMRVRY